MDTSGMADAINIPGYGPLPFVDRNPKNFFKRTTICYGPSETGKSVIIRWIMAILKPYIPNVIIISPMEGGNEGFKGIVPDRCIYTDIDVKLLQDIWKRQIEAVAVYNRANDMSTLQSLFMKCKDMRATEMSDRIRRKTQAILQQLERDRTLNVAQRMEQSKSIDKTQTSALRHIYKKTIRTYRDQLQPAELAEDERYALKYLDFNPSILLIMDDCQAQIAEWVRDTTVSQLFFQGRWNWITMIMSLQSDTGRPGLAPGIRRSTFNNFFTDASVATCFFKNAENGFTTETRKQANRIIAELFKPNPNGVENFKKMCYSRMDKKAQLRYVVADEPVGLRFGSPALWRLCESIPREQNRAGPSKFTNAFTV